MTIEGAAWTASTWMSARPAARTRRTSGGQVGDGAHLVVGELERHQAGPLGERLVERVGVDPAVAVDGHPDDLEAELLEAGARVEHRAMLHGGGHDAVADGLARPRGALDGEVDGLRAAAREHDLARVGAERRGDRSRGPRRGPGAPRRPALWGDDGLPWTPVR